MSAADGPVLIVEDDFFIGQELMHAFKACGARIAGLASDLKTAARIVEAGRIGRAVLDITVGGELVFPFASNLRMNGVPIVFTTGCRPDAVPDEFADVPIIEKPFEAPEVVRAFVKGALKQQRNRAFANGLLARLPYECLDELRTHVSLSPLRAGNALQRAGARLEHVWFIESGLCALSPRPGAVETSMIGREGALGLEALTGVTHADMHCVVHSPGVAVRIGAQALQQALVRAPGARDMLLRYLHVLHLQTASTVESASALCIRARIARWLLMAADRIGPDMPITHEIFSEIIGVRRASVTEALHELQAAGAIDRRRGHVVLLNRSMLESKAGAYGLAEDAYERLLPRRV